MNGVGEREGERKGEEVKRKRGEDGREEKRLLEKRRNGNKRREGKEKTNRKSN